jgi:hypothetical protein
LTEQQERQRYSFDIRAGTTNEEEPITSIDKTVIAYSLDAVIEYCEYEYPIKNMDEVTSDELSIFYEKSYIGQVSDHGNINEVSQERIWLEEDQAQTNILDNEGFVKEEYQGEYGNFRDVVDITGAEITQKDYEYMTSGKYWNRVIDLTEKSN